MQVPEYETNLFRYHQNERSKLRNAASDLRFLAFKVCEKEQTFPFVSKETVFDLMEANPSTVAASVLLRRIEKTKRYIEQCAPDQADDVCSYAFKIIHNTYQSLKQ